MSSRVAEKERRRAERAEREEERAASERRARRIRIAGSAAVATALAATVAATIVFGGSASKDNATPAASAQPFGQHYPGLEGRRRQAGVPTMMQTMNSATHYHPQLSVFVDGRQVPVAADIGIDPRRDPMDMAGLHTHDTSGTIHVEGAPRATLGKFFAIWGVPFSAQRLGPYRSHGGREVRVWLNGRPSRAFGSLKLADRQQIVVSYGSETRPPAAS